MVVYLCVQHQRDVEVCVHISNSDKKSILMSARLYLESLYPVFCLHALFSQQRSPPGTQKTEEISSVLIQLQQYNKLAKPHVYSHSVPCRPQLITVSLQVLPKQPVSRCIPSSCSVSLSLLKPLTTQNDDVVLTLLTFLFLWRLLVPQCRKRESERFFGGAFRKDFRIVY